MCDSDEVRDKVREELLHVLNTPEWRDWKPTAEERAALVELREAMLLLMAEASGRAIERIVDGMREFLARLRPHMEALLEEMRSLGETIVNALVEGISLLRGEEDAAFSWRKRKRKPEVRPARVVDSVAAGRNPAMVMRTRIRGGRR